MPRIPPTRKASKPVYRDVAFAVRIENAREVVVTGDFTAWSREGLRMVSRGGGSWEATLKLAPGEYQYRLLVDGEWRDDPQAPRRVPNPYGSENGVRTVP